MAMFILLSRGSPPEPYSKCTVTPPVHFCNLNYERFIVSVKSP